ARTGEWIGRPLRGAMRYAAFSHDGRMVAASMLSAMIGDEISIGVWDTSTGPPVGHSLTGMKIVHSLEFSPNGATLAVGHVGGCSFWDLTSGESLRTIMMGAPVIAFAFSSDGKSVATTTCSGWTDRPKLGFWDVATGRAITEP